MSVAAGLQGPVNGLPQRPTEVNEVIEYEKILSIYHQVIAGNHPRLKLSGPAVDLPTATSAPHFTQSPAVPPAPVLASSQPAAQTHLPGLQFTNGQKDLSARTTNFNDPSPSRRVPTKHLASELDPIFLTKSDDLVKAEIQLQRQRAERVLREQLEQKRNDARHKPSLAEAKPDFDVGDVLTKALARVKPITFDEPRGPNENGSASDSFDENSFYSSKAPDSTPRDGDDSQKSSMSKPQVQPIDNEDLDADRLVDRRYDEMQQVDLTNSPYKVMPRPALLGAPHLQTRSQIAGTSNYGATNTVPAPLDEDDDEPEYSPPEPMQPPQFRDSRNTLPGESYPERGRRFSGRQKGPYQNGRRYDSPPNTDVRIVRSHITSPIAPQPSRVSPLAVAKGPPISQNRRQRQDYAPQRRPGGVESARTSPEFSASTTQPRKKRKLQDGRKGGRRRELASPDPIIKDEPVSPPPFHDVPPLGASRHRPAQTRPIYIDDESPREVRYVSERRPEPPPTRPVVYDVEGRTPATAPRLLSRADLRNYDRPEQDLRRVVSLQNLPPREYVEPAYQTPTRLSRAPSYAIGESNTSSHQVRPYDGQPRVLERSLAREERPPPSPAYREIEPDHRYAVPSMAPPPHRRIIVDEHGNRFYETIQARQASMAPYSAKRLELDSYDDLGSVRQSNMRAASVIEEPYHEARYVQEMPPPQMVYRRVAEAARPTTSDVRYVREGPRPATADIRYVAREAVDARAGLRNGGTQIYDYAGRQPTYAEDNVIPRESIVRVSSVRPPARQYEEPQEMFQRVQSVRPEAREVGVYAEDRPQVRREAVRVEGPRYETKRTAEGDRYYRIDDEESVVLEGAVEARPSYASRY
jgi:hypothetical protein